jgi:hypothetical protein
MSHQDLSALPHPLPDYLGLEAEKTTDELFASFAQVRDEGYTYNGLAEISAWRERVAQSYHPRYAVDAVEADGEETILTLDVSGTFPDSPIRLRQRFTIRNGKIEELQTL